MLTTGGGALREDFHRRMPVDLAGLTAIEGIGPKAVKVLYERRGVRTPADLAAAAAAGKVRGLPHFGERSEQRILKGLAFLASSGPRRPLTAVLPLGEALAEALARLPRVVPVAVAGSIPPRRAAVGA